MLFQAICTQGFSGSYCRVTEWVSAWRALGNRVSGKSAFVPLKFELGEAFPFDWGEESLVIGGILRKVIASHTKLCSSRAFFISGYPGQSHEMLFDAHNRAFAALGGVAKRGIYDNMKTAVDKVSKGNGRIVNTRFHAMVSHYLFEADFCHVASGWEKGIVEKNVQDARRRIWIAAKQQPFSTYEYLNVWLEARCRVLWTELEHPDYAASGGVPLAVEYLQTHQRHHHHQPDLLGMEQRVRRCKANHAIAGSANASLPHHRHRRRVLSLQAQQCAGQRTHQVVGEDQTFPVKNGRGTLLKDASREPHTPGFHYAPNHSHRRPNTITVW